MYNICVIEISEGKREREESRVEGIFVNLPELMTASKPQIQVIQGTPIKQNKYQIIYI